MGKSRKRRKLCGKRRGRTHCMVGEGVAGQGKNGIAVLKKGAKSWLDRYLLKIGAR